jgi:histidinol-phosphate aminotransferase
MRRVSSDVTKPCCGFDPLALAQPGIRTLTAYDPGHDLIALRRRHAPEVLAELGSNESAYGCSPRVAEAIVSALPLVFRYPDPLGGDLKRVLAAHLGVGEAQLLLGNGSHELLMQFAQVFSGPSTEVVASEYGFAVYALAAQAAGARLLLAPALPANAQMSRGHDLDAMAASIGPDTRIVYIANPNNPTGTWIPRSALAAFLDGLTHSLLVVVDEAYHEYVIEPDVGSAVALLDDHPNLIVTRTFSKAYGIAGARVGYAVAHPEVIAVMERVRESFNVNLLGLVAAQAALGDQAFVTAVRQGNAIERDWLADELRSRDFRVPPSETNFLLVEFGSRCREIERALLAGGIVVRPMGGYGLGQLLRITLGRRDENARLLRELDRAWGR